MKTKAKFHFNLFSELKFIVQITTDRRHR